MRAATLLLVAAAFAVCPTEAQWKRAPDAALKRAADGTVDVNGPAPRTGGKVDLSGVWLADAEPVPKEAGLQIEGDMPFARYFINVLADVPPEQAPMLPWAAELFQKRLDGGGIDDPVAHCKPSGVPILNAVPLPLKIVQTPGVVFILYEENTVFRQLFLDSSRPVEGAVPRYMGYSTAQWDGDTLVVDTVGFSEHHWLDALGHPLTDKLRLTERFRRRDAGHLEIEVTVDDPGAYTRAFSYTIKSTLLPDEDLLEYFCADNEKDVQHFQ
jgi:hypothetical protein